LRPLAPRVAAGPAWYPANSGACLRWSLGRTCGSTRGRTVSRWSSRFCGLLHLAARGGDGRRAGRPHGVALVQPLLRPLALGGLGAVLLVVGQTYWIGAVGGAILLGLAALLAFRAVLRWDRTRLLLTN